MFYNFFCHRICSWKIILNRYCLKVSSNWSSSNQIWNTIVLYWLCECSRFHEIKNMATLSNCNLTLGVAMLSLLVQFSQGETAKDQKFLNNYIQLYILIIHCIYVPSPSEWTTVIIYLQEKWEILWSGMLVFQTIVFSGLKKNNRKAKCS